MSDTVDLTMLSGLMQETQWDLRLLRLQAGNLASQMSKYDSGEWPP